MKAIVTAADAVEPRLNDSFREYAQSRGFAIDPARVRSPKDKPRVERMVTYVRSNFFAGEQFRDLADCRDRAQQWCRDTAGMRIHGTTRLRPPRCSPPTNYRASSRCPTPRSTSRPGRTRRWLRIGMWLSPRRSTACP